MPVPTYLGADEGIEDPMMQQVYDVVNAAEYFQLYLDQYFPPAVGGVINDSVQSLLADELTPAEAAQEIQDAYLEHSN